MDLHKKVREQDRIDFIRHISHFFTELQGRVNSKSATMRSTLTNLDERFDDQIEEIDELNHRSSQFLLHFARMVELTAAKFRKQAHLCQQEPFKSQVSEDAYQNLVALSAKIESFRQSQLYRELIAHIGLNMQDELASPLEEIEAVQYWDDGNYLYPLIQFAVPIREQLSKPAQTSILRKTNIHSGAAVQEVLSKKRIRFSDGSPQESG